MPERVLTKFEDDKPTVNKTTTTSAAQNPPVALAKGKKRKRNGTTNTPTNKPDTTTQSIEVDSRPEKRIEEPESKSQLPRPATNGAKQLHNRSKSNRPPPNGRPSNPPLPPHLSKRRDALLPFRQALPIYQHADSIRAALSTKNTLILTGETGSGKSTQVPQFLLSQPWCKKCIAITQPRRVAAISLARRVAEEMGSSLGNASPASKVGYSVRFDNAAGPNTRVKFLTEGMLLQEMLRDPELKQYSAVVVDEVHERSVNVDLILGFLKKMQKEGKRKDAMKVVVMSATADVEGLVKFFDDEEGDIGCKKIERVQTDGVQSAESEKAKGKGKQKSGSGGVENGVVPVTDTKSEPSSTVSTCFVEGRQYPVKTIYLPEPTQDFVESALKSIFQIHYKEPMPGDILVFLTGQDTVEALERLVNEYAQGMEEGVPKILALPLFAALPQHAQQKIFQPAPSKTRKVILATNIAETSVTVPGVRFVVDSGKVKIKHFRNRLGLDSLLVKPISRSAAIQRQGRAGREAPGQCYRLYTEQDYASLEPRTTPEILRCDLSAALLTMKARGVEDVLNFPFLDPPPREALEKALLQLLQLGALTETGEISEIGLKISKLPLTPTLGRVLVEAARPERDCLLDIIDIISCLSVENIFVNLVTEEKKEEAEAARRELYKREGDHMTLLTTVQRYAEERSDRKVWTEKHFVSHRAMQNVMDIRKQLRQNCVQLSLLPSSSTAHSNSNSTDPSSNPSASHDSRTRSILHSLLRGFAANTARLMPDGSYRTLLGNQTVAIHPSSVLFGRKVEAIVFSEFVFTNKSYARGVSAVQLDWVGEVLEEVGG
ncbi:P-loop containing nucleoside triphosphate hydrolase protein [Delitschia confertaspora ATCC 74209]|uniref:RNA helicase n=1 Tax=Delitschia confertaspora ATCC 74209 TaxID=1513339 RepID=A0A9P4MQB5_9PLEO|nr:P-loop containing nucleoside triphosphate hydrolase protein [Delitschia confertaspora ATCC 74209]